MTLHSDRSGRLKFAAAVLLVSLAGCSGAGAGSREAEPPKVTVATPLVMELADFEDFTGRTEAAESVDIRARVTGYLTGVDFVSGEEVEKGAPLFQIDARPYKAEYDRLYAQVTLAKARLSLATADLARAERLLPTKAISQQEYDKYAATKAELDASVVATEANVEGARLNLEFTEIKSPIAGRTSRNYITAGNLVQADTTLLTSVVSQDPIFAYFDCDEVTMLKIQAGIRQGKVDSARNHDLPVYMGLATETGYPHRGTVDFVDNRVNASTGTLKLRASFDNPQIAGERVLSPGLFVRIHVPIGKPTSALLVPDRAVVTDQGLQVLYVVDSENLVVQKNVTVGRKHGEWRIIEKGLRAGDRVVVSGLQRLQPGKPVRPKLTSDAAPLPAFAPVPLKEESPHRSESSDKAKKAAKKGAAKPAEAPTTDAPEAEAPKPETPKVEAPKTAPDTSETPKSELSPEKPAPTAPAPATPPATPAGPAPKKSAP